MCKCAKHLCVSVQHVLHTVCVYTAQAGVRMSEMVKVKRIGRVSWLLFNSSHNRSCQEYWLTAFRADSPTRHVTDIKSKISTPVEEPMIITLHVLHFKYVLFQDHHQIHNIFDYWPEAGTVFARIVYVCVFPSTLKHAANLLYHMCCV